MTDDRERGLYPKYEVYKMVDYPHAQPPYVGYEPVEDWVFVLNPSTDPGAVVALRAYAQWAMDNEYYKLADDIEAMLDV